MSRSMRRPRRWIAGALPLLAVAALLATSAVDAHASATSETPARDGGGHSTRSPHPGGGASAATHPLPVVIAPVVITALPSGPPAVGSDARQAPSAGTLPLLALPVLPPPSSVLGPVPLMAPSSANRGTDTGSAIPWGWVLLLSLVDLALIAVLLTRLYHQRLSRRSR